jgi:hypothetical protein
MKSQIRTKLKIFTNLEFPLIQKSGILSDYLTPFGKDLTANGKVDNPINFSNIEIHAQNMVGRKGFEPSNPAMSRRYLNQARPPAHLYSCEVLQFCTINPLMVFIFAIIHVII